jgi:tRNA (mo5U34)-methyltransferase
MDMNIGEVRHLIEQHPYWYQKFEIFPGVITPGVYNPSGMLEALKLPADMRGLTVLEVGTAEGYFTKMLDLRGAEVTAVDYIDKAIGGFALMERFHGKPLKYVHSNLYDLPAYNLGTFDVVLCCGVLYHLPDMMRGLWVLRRHVKRDLLLETLISRKLVDEPIAEYLPGTTCNNDISNFWAPNVRCVEMMLADCGFEVAEILQFGERALFRARLSAAARASEKIALAYSLR